MGGRYLTLASRRLPDVPEEPPGREGYQSEYSHSEREKDTPSGYGALNAEGGEGDCETQHRPEQRGEGHGKEGGCDKKVCLEHIGRGIQIIVPHMVEILDSIHDIGVHVSTMLPDVMHAGAGTKECEYA